MSTLDRASIVDANFMHYVAREQLPPARQPLPEGSTGLDKTQCLALFESQLRSRHLDLQARRLKENNHSFYTIGSSGHEGNAAVALAFRHTDMAFLHYRSGAFVLQRARALPEINMTRDILLSLVASKADPIANGRHKVFGSVPLCIPPQTSTIASHLPKAVGMAFSLRRAQELAIATSVPYDSVVLCSFGDASSNHSTAQGAFNAAAWIVQNRYPLPLVFICEDNGIGISVPTPEHWLQTRFSHYPGLTYLHADGLDLSAVYAAAKQAEQIARYKRQPVFLHLRMVRLLGHAGSDIEVQYRSAQQIEQTEFNDPLLHTARYLLEQGYLSSAAIVALYQQIGAEVAQLADAVVGSPHLVGAAEIMASIIPPSRHTQLPALPTAAQRSALWQGIKTDKRNLCQQINLALHDVLLRYPTSLVFGEDVAKKGGVYRVTADLMARFGQRRVFDTLLDEQTILGHAIGLAQNGFLPIPEIQFLAYLHNAEDQLRGEAATLSFFSSGQYTNPMVLRIAGLGYQKGFGGHFHNDNSIAVLRDIPGLIIACPAQGEDAARLLQTCVALAYAQQRVVVFLEPIALYMTKDLHEAGDNLWLSDYNSDLPPIALGELGIYGEGTELAIVSYANGYYLSRQAAQILQQRHGVACRVIDLRWLAPLNEAGLLQALAGCTAVLVVDEGRKTGSLSEGICTLLLEQLRPLPHIKRITGEDTFIPLGPAWHYVLPSCETIVAAAEQLLYP